MEAGLIIAIFLGTLVGIPLIIAVPVIISQTSPLQRRIEAKQQELQNLAAMGHRGQHCMGYTVYFRENCRFCHKYNKIAKRYGTPQLISQRQQQNSGNLEKQVAELQQTVLAQSQLMEKQSKMIEKLTAERFVEGSFKIPVGQNLQIKTKQ